MCAPPGADGEVDPVVLGACRLAGASAVYRMGGAQAIAALAYGTETVAAVDVIVGPGNLYVQEAKRQVFGQVGIDGFAGPSDLLVIASARTPIRGPLALDLLAQAEHGPGSLVIADLDLGRVARRARARIAPSPTRAPCRDWWHVADLEQALGSREAFAPEHLELVGRRGRGARAPSHAGRLRVRRTRQRRRRSATTSPAPTTSCRPTARRASPRRSRRRTSDAASPR